QVDLSKFDAPAGSAPKAAEAPAVPGPSGTQAPSELTVPLQPQPTTQSTPTSAQSGEGQPRETPAEVKASPLARVMAEQAGVDLQTLAGKGSGPGGRIVRQDVESAFQQGAAVATPTSPAAAPAAAAPGATYEDRDLNRVRQAIARNLANSKPGAPHIYLTIEVEMDAALALRKQLNEIAEDERSRISVNDLVLKATALALRKHPDLNAHFLGGTPPKVRYFNQIHLTIAFPGEAGLMVPVLKDVDRKSLGQLTRDAKNLYDRVRNNKPLPDDFSGGTFATSNLGTYGIDEFQAVINPPQAGILAVGAATPKAVVKDGQIVVRTTMRVTISADHRVVDGVYAAQFLQEFKRLLEQPLSLVL
ncbi:MAG TPA: dihydrolipoamide acetyltransferase family protein, partial [Chloroflexota bacterium]|nr:dihydrolipoamide acetyltransferase family protein [Chloroflexota bacterium]